MGHCVQGSGCTFCGREYDHSKVAKEWMTGLLTKTARLRPSHCLEDGAENRVHVGGRREARRNNPFKELKISVPRKTVERETKAFMAQEAEVILSAALATRRRKLLTNARAGGCRGYAPILVRAQAKLLSFEARTFSRRGNDYFAKLSPSAGKMKTRTARTVPLHEHLVEQGFVAFVEEMGSGNFILRTRPSPSC